MKNNNFEVFQKNLTGKCPHRQISSPANVVTGKCHHRQMSRFDFSRDATVFHNENREIFFRGSFFHEDTFSRDIGNH